MKDLNSPIQYLKGIGPKKAKLFHKIGIYTIEDLFYYFPRRYEDRRQFLSINQLKEGEFKTIKAKILSISEKESWKRKDFKILEVRVADETGEIFCVWFNQPYLKEYFKTGQDLILYGRIERYGKRLQINSPEFEIISKDLKESLDIGRISPIYPLPSGLTQRKFRQFIKSALDEYLTSLNDFLPYDLRSRNNLLNLAKAILNIHFPEDFNLQKQAYERLSFEEFFLFQLPLALRKLKKYQKPGIAHHSEGKLLKDFILHLPFKLTPSQVRVIAEIKSDMAKPYPMHRLLQGEVGSGKTIVAASSSLIAIESGYQVAFMVPTEILAKQHYAVLGSWFSGLSNKIRMGLLTSSLSQKEREKMLEEIKAAKIDLIIGTHALLEEEVEFKKLGLVVIDEQHKFGVGQRALLPQKGINPDVLIMTATPIPRTLAITIYGDLDLSVITDLPPERKPVKTMHYFTYQRQEVYNFLKQQLKKGYQAYIIYPTIEETYRRNILNYNKEENLWSIVPSGIKGAKKMYETLKNTEFKDFKLGLIHGRLKQKEQDIMMQKFKEKKLDILIATTVLEVGIDAPNANIMIIEYAENFGLAQLHQLRGRIGRGKEESYCILISDLPTQEAKMRIETLIKYSDGFRIAEEDLKIRGPGEFFGRRQHGLSELKIAHPLTQMQLLKKARQEALRLVSKDPFFQLRQNILLKEKLLQRFPEYEKLVVVG